MAIDGPSSEQEYFDNIEDARKWLEEGFLDAYDGCHYDMSEFAIYKLVETVELETLESKSDYRNDDDDDDNREEWPYNPDWDTISKHKFIEYND